MSNYKKVSDRCYIDFEARKFKFDDNESPLPMGRMTSFLKVLVDNAGKYVSDQNIINKFIDDGLETLDIDVSDTTLRDLAKRARVIIGDYNITKKEFRFIKRLTNGYKYEPIIEGSTSSGKIETSNSPKIELKTPIADPLEVLTTNITIKCEQLLSETEIAEIQITGQQIHDDMDYFFGKLKITYYMEFANVDARSAWKTLCEYRQCIILPILSAQNQINESGDNNETIKGKILDGQLFFLELQLIQIYLAYIDQLLYDSEIDIEKEMLPVKKTDLERDKDRFQRLFDRVEVEIDDMIRINSSDLREKTSVLGGTR